MKLKDRIAKSRTQEDIEALKSLIQDDIIHSIEENLRADNITEQDARLIKSVTHKLYEHIYSHYKELEELNDMTDESLMLEYDEIEKEHAKALAEKDREYAQKLAEKDNELAEKDNELAEKDNEIELLKKELFKLKNNK